MHHMVRSQYYEDYVWLIQTDQVKNYRDYFSDSNPCNLVNKFKVEERMKNMKMSEDISVSKESSMSSISDKDNSDSDEPTNRKFKFTT